MKIAINFIAGNDTDEERVMHLNSDNIETIINDKADGVVEEHFQSLLSKYQIELETSIKDSDFVFNCVHFFYC